MIPKKFAGIFTVLFTIIFLLCSLTNSYATETGETQFLKNIRQLTYEGKRAGEGYFSEDGKTMIFQSEREPENPFFQIYLLDFETRRYQPCFARNGQDHLLILQARYQRGALCLDPP